ncbi:NAD(P)-dependent oxidoreductase [Vibrio splendidus]
MKEIYVHPILSESEKEHFTSKVSPEFAITFNYGDHSFEAAKEAAIAIGNFDTAWIVEMANLEVILLDSVGTDNFNGYQWAEDNNVTVHNLNDFFSMPVAEEAIANIMSIYRQIPALNAAKEQSKWIKDDIRGEKRLISEAKALLVGNGNIGKKINELLTIFGCEVSIFDRAEMDANGKAGLKEAVSKADIVVSTLPATPATNGIFDRQIFNAMQKNATFLNLGRGPVVNEADLAEKAESNSGFNACLDVTIQEPLPITSPLWALSNIWLTQHTGGGSPTENIKKIDIYLEQLERIIKKQPLINKVNF